MIFPPPVSLWLRILVWLAFTAALPLWLLMGALAGLLDAALGWWRLTRELWLS